MITWIIVTCRDNKNVLPFLPLLLCICIRLFHAANAKMFLFSIQKSFFQENIRVGLAKLLAPWTRTVSSDQIPFEGHKQALWATIISGQKVTFTIHGALSHLMAMLSKNVSALPWRSVPIILGQGGKKEESFKNKVKIPSWWTI